MSKNTKKPSQEFPELINHLAKISHKSYELGQLTKPESMARVLKIKKQSFQAHVDKIKKEANRE